MQISNRKFQVAAGVLFLISLIVVSHGADPLPARFLLLLVLLVKHGLYAAGWLAAAVGFGSIARRANGVGWVEQAAIGAGILMMLDWLMGWAGWLNPVTAWALCAMGWVLLAASLRTATVRERSETACLRARLVLFAAPAVGLLLGAACIAPGVLWHPTEVGGYDALEYHLQLPVEWAQAGSIRGFEHNAYSYLPSLLEAAYMHLHIWSGYRFEWAHAAQLLHAVMALLAALGIARIVHALTGSHTWAGLSAAIYLATPWTIVTGSMAYNEQAVMALGVAALSLTLRSGWLGLNPGSRDSDEVGRGIEDSAPATPLSNALLIGILCGLAALVKLTAAGMIAAPVALILLLSPTSSARIRRIMMFALGAGLTMAPFLIRNAIWTGNPVFPMFTELFGTGHWTAEQAQRWSIAHGAEGSLPHRIGLLLSSSRGLLHPQFGYILAPLAILGASFGLVNTALRRVTWAMLLMLTVQALFWLTLTHNQSRFLIPMLLPICVLIGIAGAAAVPSRLFSGIGRAGMPAVPVLAVVVLILTLLSFLLYFRQTEGHAAQLIGGTKFITREGVLYRTLNRLPHGSRVYGEGFATPFYVTTPIDYHTVWDRSPLGKPLSAGGPVAAAAWLREQGYTHVVIDWVMLDLWTSPGNYGYDPLVSLDAVEQLAAHYLEPVSDQNTSLSTVPLVVYRVKPH